MKTTYLGLLISLFATGFAFSQGSASKPQIGNSDAENPSSLNAPAIDNAYFRVSKNTTAGSEGSTNLGTRVIVALTNVVIQSSRGKLDLKRGQIAEFHLDETFKPPTGEYFEVAIKTNHPPLKAPEKWIEPTKNIIVYEDAEFRVFEERLEPGETRELHSHAQRIVVRLNEVQLTDPRFHDGPRSGKGLQVPNTAKFAEPIVHVVRNLSKVPLFNIVIEFKLPH
jgi:hypothetical protein